jgi:hypothetical protein
MLFHHQAVGIYDLRFTIYDPAMGLSRELVIRHSSFVYRKSQMEFGCGRWVRTIDCAFRERRVADYSIPQKEWWSRR